MSRSENLPTTRVIGLNFNLVYNITHLHSQESRECGHVRLDRHASEALLRVHANADQAHDHYCL